MQRSASNTKVIFISIPTDERAERLKFEGVLKYAHDKRDGKWRIETDPGGLLPHIASDFSRFHYAGVIAYVTSEKMRTLLAGLPCPVVLIEDLDEPKQPVVGQQMVTLLCDHEAEGRAAARYLMSRRLASYAWIGPTRKTSWANLRKKGFAQELAASGNHCRSYPMPKGEARSNFAVEIDRLAAWLSKLPRPAGVFACRDLRARQVVAAADKVLLPIPNGLAVLGVDDDEIICTTTDPSLSSVACSDRSIGYSAGRILNELIQKRSTGRLVRVHHPRIVIRMSTEIEAAQDPYVLKALRYAKQHLREKLTIDLLAQKIGLPRHELQTRTVQTLCMPIGRAVQQIRLKAAMGMIVGSQTSIQEIASTCGYVCMSYLSTCTKAAYGLTPLQLRQRAFNRNQTNYKQN